MSAPPVDPQKVALVTNCLRERFPGYDLHTAYDPDGSAQFFHLGLAGASAHRVYVSPRSSLTTTRRPSCAGRSTIGSSTPASEQPALAR